MTTMYVKNAIGPTDIAWKAIELKLISNNTIGQKMASERGLCENCLTIDNLTEYNHQWLCDGCAFDLEYKYLYGEEEEINWVVEGF